MARRPIALVSGAALLVEAVGVVLLHGVLATVLSGQRMSLAGLDPDAMIAGTWAMGGAFGLYLAVCGTVLLITGVRDRRPGRAARILLISCAITHGVLGAVTVGLVGWSAFVFMMVMLALVVLSLVAYAPEAGHRAAPDTTGTAPTRPPGDADGAVTPTGP
ncbi:hypothetical protein [Streptomyces sp. NPDC047928]|uniref:hypothetical protein n=1 Tax=unclassified Streptomyces TaxID=2593676 RepID=UPI0037190F2E